MKREDWIEYYETVYGEAPSDEVVATALQSGAISDRAPHLDSRHQLTTSCLQEEELPTQHQFEATKPSVFKRKQFWLLSFLTLAAIAIIAGGMTMLSYHTGWIQGYFRSAKLEKELAKEIGQQFADIEKDSGVELDKVITSQTVALDVSDNEAKFFVSYIFDKDVFYQTYQETLSGSDYAQYLEKEYGSLLQSILPSRSEIDKMIDDTLEEVAKEEGYDYDRKTGKLKATLFTGKVHPITRTIEITDLKKNDMDLNDMDIDEGDYIRYQKNHSDVVLKGKTSKDDIVFKKGTISATTTY